MENPAFPALDVECQGIMRDFLTPNGVGFPTPEGYLYANSGISTPGDHLIPALSVGAGGGSSREVRLVLLRDSSCVSANGPACPAWVRRLPPCFYAGAAGCRRWS